MGCGVILQTGVGRGATRATLIEQNNTVELRIEIAPIISAAARAGAIVHKQHGDPLGITGFIHIQLMRRLHIKLMALVRFYLWVVDQHEDRKSTRLNSRSRGHLVCRLLLEKKKKKRHETTSVSL